MAWQTPKTDWSSVDGVRDTDLNRIEGNSQHLHDNLLSLKQNVDEALFVASQRIDIGDLSVGAELAIYENGVLVPYIKLSNNYEGTGRSLVVRKNSYTTDVLLANATGYYSGSKADTLLNNEFINVLNSATLAAIAAVNIYVASLGGVATLSRKVFLLSRTEYNLSHTYIEGTSIPYFNGAARRIAGYDGAGFDHWTRSIVVGANNTEASYITYDGYLGTGSPSALTLGIRPAFTLPANFQVIAGMPSTANILAAAEVV